MRAIGFLPICTPFVFQQVLEATPRVLRLRDCRSRVRCSKIPQSLHAANCEVAESCDRDENVNELSRHLFERSLPVPTFEVSHQEVLPCGPRAIPRFVKPLPVQTQPLA